MMILTLDIPAGIAYTGDYESTPDSNLSQSSQRVFLCPQYNYSRTQERGRKVFNARTGQPVGAAKLLSGSLPTSLLCFFDWSFRMPDSNEVATKHPAVPTLHYWQLFATDGPADLYRGFAIDAVDEYLRTLGTITDEQMTIITECVNIAATVALRAAGVADSWLPMYEAATSPRNTKQVQI